MNGSLTAVRQELESIRSGLVTAAFTHSGSFELLRRLESAVAEFQKWTAANSGEPSSRSDLEAIRQQLAELQPLFDQAQQLQSGWFQLAGGTGENYNAEGGAVAQGSHSQLSVVG